MPLSDAETDDLEQVYELNRLFLELLKSRADNGGDCLGLPADAIDVLRSSERRDLEYAAELPRALFTFDLNASRASTQADVDAADADAIRSLQLTVLVTVWNFCRRNAYAARAFFGLSLDAVAKLRMTPLSQLHAYASGERPLACAFADSAWLWCKLLTATELGGRRQLSLVALQPNIQLAATTGGARPTRTT